jgi:hypothetical protein
VAPGRAVAHGLWSVHEHSSGEQRPGGDRGEPLESEPAQADAPAASRQFADALRARSLATAEHPGEKRGRCESRDRRAQRGAGAVQQTPDGAVAEPQRTCYLLVAVPGDGGAQDDLALHAGERGDAAKRLARGQTAAEIGLGRRGGG